MLSSPYFLNRFIILMLLIISSLWGQNIPAVYANITMNEDGRLVYTSPDGEVLPLKTGENEFSLEQMRNRMAATDVGLKFDFADPELSGWVYFGLIDMEESRYPGPIYYHTPAVITEGVAEIDVKKRLKGRYDFTDWETTGIVNLGYRVINQEGWMLFDGKITLHGTGPFTIAPSVLEGPFVNLVTPHGCTISFETNQPVKSSIQVDGLYFGELTPVTHHEIRVEDLKPNREYVYTLIIEEHSETYSFRTAPKPGARKSFTFAYASDSRAGSAAGERSLYGVNRYILNRIGALSMQEKVRFLQFTGDLVSGYKIMEGEMNLELVNWKRAVEPYAHYMPFIATMGNHEAYGHVFDDGGWGAFVDKFPFETQSAEKLFADHFVNPLNGPDSEDGSRYDPDPDQVDFPSYKENVFYYTYDNVAVINLNSDYWYAPSIHSYPSIGGNLHGYLMDNQLSWLEETLKILDEDRSIDHIFTTQHTPVFPNGGHVKDDMWYGGNNEPRAYVAGEPVEKGIIQRRDEYLQLLLNSKKVVAVLTGDEHNYNRMQVTEDTPIYPEEYSNEKLDWTRPLWFINNGAAGAPYYAQENTPWTESVDVFSTQNALVLFDVDGKHIEVRVLNPDTLEEVDTFTLR